MPTLRLLLIDEASAASPVPADLIENEFAVVVEHCEPDEPVDMSLKWFEPELVLCDAARLLRDGARLRASMQALRPGAVLAALTDGRDDERDVALMRNGVAVCLERSDRLRLWGLLRHAATLTAERRMARAVERGLRDSEARFRLFMDHLPAAVYMKDLAGRFTYVNAACERVLGRPAAELLGQSPTALFGAEVAQMLAHNDRQALSVRQPVQAMESLCSADGSLHMFLSIKFPVVSPSGEPTMLGGISIETTDNTAGAAALVNAVTR